MGHVVSVGATSPKIYVAHFDISGDSNAHSISHTIALPDDTNYGDSFKQRLPGLIDVSVSVTGNVDQAGATDSDTIIDARMGVQDVPLIICPVGSAVGDPCAFGLVGLGQYNRKLVMGDLYKFDLAASIANRIWVHGKVLATPATAVTGTTNGAEVLIGAASAAQSLYVGIAITTYSGAGSVTVRVESDTTGFASATVQKTFTAATVITSEMPAAVDGAITDTYYRAAVSAFTATSVNMIVVAGIR